ncbi:hypothetical protein [Adhaeribacter aerolatus]|uniref:hypothetical protein n=1 Tax=Adhaeribacter aerolatus TaxID=670289 RepID=UPI0011BF4419|nr:hypothetical protein [Adhaeribacter aerolatus]
MKKPYYTHKAKYQPLKGSNPSGSNKKRSTFKKILKIVLLVLFAFILGLGVYAKFAHFLHNHVK